MHSVLLPRNFQPMNHSLFHFLETTTHILQSIPQTGTYSDRMKTSQSSFELPMATLAMFSDSYYIINFCFSFTYFSQLLYHFGGVSPQGVYWSLNLAPHHVVILRNCFLSIDRILP